MGVEEQKSKILAAVDTKTKLLALIALIAEAMFISSIPILDKSNSIYALIVCAVILIVTIIGIIWIEYFEKGGKKRINSVDNDAGSLIDNNDFLEKLITQTLHTMCRAVCIPNSPETTKIRAFIFKKVKKELVCQYYWTLHPVREIKGELKFKINSENEKNIASVNAIKIRDMYGAKVAPLSQDYKKKHISGEIIDVNYVLAAPIYHGNNIWGAINFDTTDEFGEKILTSEVARAAIYQLTLLLQEIIQLDYNFVKEKSTVLQN